MRAPWYYRACVRLLPEGVRRRYGSDLEEAFLAVVAGALPAGRGAARRTKLRAVLDVLGRVPHEHGRVITKATARRLEMAGGMVTEGKQAMRGFRRQPGTTGLIVLMIALGIAATTTVFTLIYGLFLRPLPWAESDRLVYMNETAPRWNLEFTGINYPDFDKWRQNARAFEGMALYGTASFNVAFGPEAQRIDGAEITHDFLSVLRVRPVLGRGFTAEEDKPNAAPVALISEGLWRTQFGGNRNVLGKSIRVNSRPYTIVGVLPREASFPETIELWVPMAGDPAQPWQSYSWDGVGRLKAGVTMEQAAADLTRAHQPIWEANDSAHTVSPRLQGLREHYVGDYKAVAVVLGGGVLIVLLIACANVSSVMLARASARMREIGIRRALGARNSRIARQLLIENAALSLIGGAWGLLGGYWAVQALMGSLPDSAPPWIQFGLDARITGFSIVMAFAVAILSGFAPLVQSLRADVPSILGSEAGTRTTASRGHRRTLNALVVLEIALACVLLVGGGLLLRTYQRVQSVDPGFRADRVLTFRVYLPPTKYVDGAAQRRFFEAAVARLQTLPGVRSVAAINCPPLTCHWGNFLRVEGAPARPENDPYPVTIVRVATPQYAATMGISVMRGRFLADEDLVENAPRAVVINESFAREFFRDVANPVGRRIKFNNDREPWMTVVGVLHDVKHYGLDKPMRPGIYLPLSTTQAASLALTLRTSVEPTSVIGAARSAMRELDAELPLFDVRTMKDQLDRSLADRRIYSWMLAVFASVALVLALGGIYGVLSYVVGQRRREIGIRVALGAQKKQVLRLVLRDGAILAVAGTVLGLLGAFAAARAVADLLFGISPVDPLTYVGVAILLTGTAAAATLAPARRAVAVDPYTILRE